MSGRSNRSCKPGARAQRGDAVPTGSARQGYLHCGPAGAGHFVKMVHNGIEYGLMAAYAEGFNLLHAAGRVRRNASRCGDLAAQQPDAYRYEFDLHAIAELWRHGSVVRSWLLDLVAAACKDPTLAQFSGQVSDSGKAGGRWLRLLIWVFLSLSWRPPSSADLVHGEKSVREQDPVGNAAGIRRASGEGVTYPPDFFAAQPSRISSATRRSRWSPWISMIPSRTVRPSHNVS